MEPTGRDPSAIGLVVGLGNPGPRYAGTRHNVGFAILDRLAARGGAVFAPERRWKCEVARLAAGGPVLLKPQTYMNLSGEAVAPAARFYKLEPAAVLAVYDDAALPFGRLRFRAGGSAGGHNGVRSLITNLGTDQFPRLKFGVAAPGLDPRTDLADHVLGKFSAGERADVENYLDAAVDALNFALAQGLEAAMNAFNRALDPGPPPAGGGCSAPAPPGG